MDGVGRFEILGAVSADRVGAAADVGIVIGLPTARVPPRCQAAWLATP